jgi:hypothetical protein
MRQTLKIVVALLIAVGCVSATHIHSSQSVSGGNGVTSMNFTVPTVIAATYGLTDVSSHVSGPYTKTTSLVSTKLPDGWPGVRKNWVLAYAYGN